MPLITLIDLENAQRDSEDLGKIVGQVSPTTVTTRLGAVVKTISKVISDGDTKFSTVLSPIVYDTTVQRDSALATVTLGQIAYDRETTQLYVAVDPVGSAPREWVQLSNISSTISAQKEELIARSSSGTVNVNDYYFLKDRDAIFEKDALKKYHIRWPGKATTANGLANVLGYAAWPTNAYGQEGVDYGCRIAEIDLVDYTTLPDYEAAHTRLKLLPASDLTVTGVKVFGGHIDITSTVATKTVIEDCLIDTNYVKIAGIAQNNEDFPVYIRNCTIKRFLGESITLRKGHVINCDISLSQADGVKFDAFDGVLDNNMIRLLGQVDPGAHGDVVQVQNAADLVITRNTFYMPGTGTTYDEISNGTTQCIRLVTENASYSIKRVEVAGNLLIGGGYSMSIWSRFTGALMENIIVCNNVFGTADYYVYGPIDNRHHSGQHLGTLRNLILWGNIKFDGSPITYGGVDQNGIWHYDKNYATERFIEVGKKLGYLDWNGDLKSGVVNRTS